jgi:zinc-ribbon domain
MRLFRRKAATDEVPEERCPYCSERVPDGANECHMCGADLRVLRPRSPEELVKDPAAPH